MIWKCVRYGQNRRQLLYDLLQLMEHLTGEDSFFFSIFWNINMSIFNHLRTIGLPWFTVMNLQVSVKLDNSVVRWTTKKDDPLIKSWDLPLSGVFLRFFISFIFLKN